MFHLSRALVFIACLAAAVFVNWQIGLIGWVVAMFFIPNTVRRTK
jgi:phage shock protein PspC (stress-responsive transcriptional regulator)